MTRFALRAMKNHSSKSASDKLWGPLPLKEKNIISSIRVHGDR